MLSFITLNVYILICNVCNFDFFCYENRNIKPISEVFQLTLRVCCLCIPEALGSISKHTTSNNNNNNNNTNNNNNKTKG